MGPRPRLHFTSRADGDFAVDSELPGLARRRAGVARGPWSWLHQVHGATAVVVRRPGEHAGATADASVTATPGAVLSVQTADCVPVVLIGSGPQGPVVGAVHVGWRGLVAGVAGAAMAAARELGATEVRAVVGPHIGPECYEFGEGDLATVAAHLGDGVRALTSTGTPALDLGAAALRALATAGVTDVSRIGGCTACDAERYFSHRARGERERQAAVVWLEP